MNSIIVGERIREARNNYGYSQSALAEALGLSSATRTTVARWERGEALPALEYILKMCEIFNCQSGYILGEFPLPTKAETDIQKETGLSASAIAMLRKYKAISDAKQKGTPVEESTSALRFIAALSKLITHRNFYFFVCDIDKYGEVYHAQAHATWNDKNCKNANILEQSLELRSHGWYLLSSKEAAKHWFRSAFDTLRGIVEDIWEEEY